MLLKKLNGTGNTKCIRLFDGSFLRYLLYIKHKYSDSLGC